MNARYGISSFQLFFFVFSCVFSGLFIYGGNNAVTTVLVCAFCAVLCTVVHYISRTFSSSRELYSAYLGRFAPVLCALSLIFVSFGGVRTLYAFSQGVTAYYKNANESVIFLSCVFLCVFAVRASFSCAARFAELCAFVIFMIFLLCLLGGGGDVLLSFSSEDVPFLLGAIPGIPVIFSLYLRTISEEEMSDFAKYGGIQPKKAVCGVVASFAAGAFYLFVCAMGADKGILLNIFAYFLCISRFFAYAVSAVDILGIPEGEKEKTPKKAIIFAAVCAVAIFLYGVLPEYYIRI